MGTSAWSQDSGHCCSIYCRLKSFYVTGNSEMWKHHILIITLTCYLLTINSHLILKRSRWLDIFPVVDIIHPSSPLFDCTHTVHTHVFLWPVVLFHLSTINTLTWHSMHSSSGHCFYCLCRGSSLLAVMSLSSGTVTTVGQMMTTTVSLITQHFSQGLYWQDGLG